MTWPGATLYLGWVACMFGYIATHSMVLLIATLVMLVAYIVWRFAPARSASCQVPVPPREDQSKNATV